MRASLVLPFLAGCSTDLPEPNSPPPDESMTVAEARTAATSCHDDDGAPVSLSAVVVTAVDAFDESGQGDVGTIYVEEPAGGAGSGLAVFAPTGATDLRTGDVVDVSGLATQFELGCIDPGWTDDTGRTVTQLVSARVTWTGEWTPPVPADVSVADFSDDARAESLEGMLVRVEDVTAAAPPVEGRIDVGPDLQIDDDLYAIPDVTTGTAFASVTGVVSYIYTYSVLPRGADDVVR